MLFAFIYLVLQKRQALSESKGEALFSARISSLLLFLSVVSFIVRPSSCLTQARVGGDTAGHGVVPRGPPLALAELRFANKGLRVPAKQMKLLQRFRCFLLADMLARTVPCPVQSSRDGEVETCL